MTSAFGHYWRKSPSAIAHYRARKAMSHRRRSVSRPPAGIRKALDRMTGPTQDQPFFVLGNIWIGKRDDKFAVYLDRQHISNFATKADAERGARELAETGSISR
jgi:hypothetical protein